MPGNGAMSEVLGAAVRIKGGGAETRMLRLDSLGWEGMDDYEGFDTSLGKIRPVGDIDSHMLPMVIGARGLILTDGGCTPYVKFRKEGESRIRKQGESRKRISL